MPIPDLESATPSLFSTTDIVLGDTITMVPPSAIDGPTFKAHVEFEGDRLDFGGASHNVQAVRIDMDKAVHPAKPDPNYRVRIAALPGKIYIPRDVTGDDDPHRWSFALTEYRGG